MPIEQLQGLKRRLGSCKENWLEELLNVLWSYRTTPRRATEESPFNLCFSVEALIPTKFGVKSLRSETFDENLNRQLMEESLVLLDKLWERATQKDFQYKKAIAMYHNTRVKQSRIQEGDPVLQKNEISRLTQIENWILFGKVHICYQKK